MPANKKYLTTSPYKKILKLIVGLFGGLMISIELTIILSYYLDSSLIIVISSFMGFVVWAFLFLTTYMIKNIWLAIIGNLSLLLILSGFIQFIIK